MKSTRLKAGVLTLHIEINEPAMIRMILSLFMLDLDTNDGQGYRPRERGADDPGGRVQSRVQKTSRIMPIKRSVRASSTR